MKIGNLALAAALLLSGCVRGPMQPDSSRRDCVTVEVENHRFNDVVLYHIDSRRRFGRASGLRDTQMRMCNIGLGFRGVSVRVMGETQGVPVYRIQTGFDHRQTLRLRIGTTWGQTYWHEG